MECLPKSSPTVSKSTLVQLVVLEAQRAAGDDVLVVVIDVDGLV